MSAIYHLQSRQLVQNFMQTIDQGCAQKDRYFLLKS